jgi:aspartate beta-hydroxylase
MSFDSIADVDDPDVYRIVRNIRRALRRDDYAEAERLCLTLIEQRPAHETALAFLAARALEDGDAARSRRHAENGIAAAPGSAVLHFHLGAALERLADPAAAQAAYARAWQLDSEMLPALVCRGAQEQLLGHREQMLATYVEAIQIASRAGFFVEPEQLPEEFRTRLQQGVDCVQAARESAIEQSIAPLVARHGAAALQRIQRALDQYLGKAQIEWPHPLQRPTFLLVPDLPPQAWFDREKFPFLSEIEKFTDAIREEMLAVLADESELTPYVDMPEDAPAAPVWRELNRSPRWSSYHLFRHGEPIAAHCARCPKTVAALQSIPVMRIPEHAPEALFSVLKPKTHIPPHTGVINGRLTVHLPLVVPENCGMLKAGDEARAWQVGRCLIFDDSMVHEAWNDSEHTRVVLIFDIWNPYLDEVEREGLSAAIAAIGRFNRRYGRRDDTVET